jgi:RHS repeat-associated protein
MKRHRTAFVTLLALLLGWGRVVWADPPETFERGTGKYVLVLADPRTTVDDPKTGKKRAHEPDVARHGGKVLFKKDGTRVIKLPVKAAGALRKEQNVAYLQRIWLGESAQEWAEEQSQSSSLRSEATPAVETDPEGLTWATGEYLYDGSGSIKQIGEGTYKYDTLGRLKQSVTNGVTETYQYDSFGNLVEKSANGVIKATPVDAVSNRLRGETYDVAGNLTTRAGTPQYHYDSFSMIDAKERPSQRIIYGPDDERIGVINDSSLSRWKIRDFHGQVLREFKGDDVGGYWLWLEDYVYAGGRAVAAEREAYFSGKRYLHTDHLGTVRMITTQDRKRLGVHEFSPFGVERTDATQETKLLGEFTGGDSRSEPMKFTGHERDWEGWLNVDNDDYVDYMHARYYDPNLGRFLSVDRVLGEPDQPQSWNRYAYARNSPVRLVDPDGNEEVEFTIRHFIPASTVALPHGRNLGDGRNFSLRANASVRTERTLRVETDPAANRSGIVGIDPPRIGMSENLTFGLTGRASGASMTVEARRIPGMGVLVTTTQNEMEPMPMSMMAPQAAMFLTGRGGIRSTVNIFITENASAIYVFGSRSSFPAMEINARVGNRTFAIFRGTESQIPGGFGIFGTELIDRQCTQQSGGSYTCK